MNRPLTALVAGLAVTAGYTGLLNDVELRRPDVAAAAPAPSPELALPASAGELAARLTPPTSSTPPTSPPTGSTPPTSPPAPSSTLPAAPGARCPEWWATARQAGWPEDALPRLDAILWRESRCTNGLSHRNRNRSVDVGLTQLNSIHRRWLAAAGISWAATQHDPALNLRAARLLYDRAARMFGCGWQPWNLGGWC